MRRTKTDHGTTAIIVAIMATLLFSIAALSFDLGNAWARKRDVQTEADLAVLAGGAHLPATAGDAAVLQEVLDYLTLNSTVGQDEGTWTTAQLENGDIADGEAYFSPDGNRLEVVTPSARVDFGFASVMGHDDVDVNARAAVEIRSPGDMLPMFLPSSCAYGTVRIKSSTHGAEGPAPLFDYPSPGGTSGQVPRLNHIDKLAVDYQTPTTLAIEGRRFLPAPTKVLFTLDGNNHSADPATVTQGSGNVDDKLEVSVPSVVLNRPGLWYVRVQNANGITPDNGALTFRVAEPVAPDPDCGQRENGDFGLIDSPRSDTNQQADAYALNTIKGLDHQVSLHPNPEGFPDPAVRDSCDGLGSGASAPVGTVPDKAPPTDGANCLFIQTGNWPPMVTRGLVTGVDLSTGEHLDGRLDVDTTPDCNGSSRRDLGSGFSQDINNDLLTCFLEPGVTVGEISCDASDVGCAPPEGALSADVFESPRFFVVPVLGYPVNPPNGAYPIIEFRPVFITDEGSTGSSTYATASSDNGVFLGPGGNTISGVSVVVIHPDALPPVASSAGPTMAYLGTGTKILRLVE